MSRDDLTDTILCRQWKASCKGGTAKFSYSGALPSTRTFNEPLDQPADSKKKMLTFTPQAFGDIAEDDITTGVQYASLSIRGEKVNVR